MVEIQKEDGGKVGAWQQAKGKRAEMNAGSFCLFEFLDRIGKTNGDNLGGLRAMRWALQATKYNAYLVYLC